MDKSMINVLEDREHFLAYRALDQAAPDRIDRIIEFLCLVGRLKTLDRRGWTVLEARRRITKPESVAGHMYRMAIMAMLMNEDDDEDDEFGEEQNGVELVNGTGNKKKKLDIGKMMQLALVHDMAECMVGDVTPLDGIEPETKHKAEQDVMSYLISLLPPKVGRHLGELYKEYEDKATPEAKIVKELDRFDIMVETFQNEQYAQRYEKRAEVSIPELHTPSAVNRHPLLRAIFDRIDRARKTAAALFNNKH